jgi:hypothetical protein
MLLIPGILASRFTPQGDFESIATVTVGAGGTSTITFASIAGTYQHLQVRYIARCTTGTAYIKMNFNNDTGSNYSWHELYGAGAVASAAAGASQTFGIGGDAIYDTANGFNGGVIDILDYANTNKHKTTRSLCGQDNNGSGTVYLISSRWGSGNAINEIDFTLSTGNFAQYSHFALYGIKG